jgi:hypothetical protein
LDDRDGNRPSCHGDGHTRHRPDGQGGIGGREQPALVQLVPEWSRSALVVLGYQVEGYVMAEVAQRPAEVLRVTDLGVAGD